VLPDDCNWRSEVAVNLDLTAEQAAFEESLDRFFGARSPAAVVRAAEPSGFDRRLWQAVVDQGLPMLTVPSDLGGGAGTVEAAIAALCVGRYLAPVPLIEACVANQLLAEVVQNPRDLDRVTRSVIADVLGNGSIPTLAVRPVVGDVATVVPAGAVADAVVVLCGDDLLLVTDGRRRVCTPNLGALPLADWSVRSASPYLLARGPRARTLYQRARAEWQALTSAALVGLGFRALDIGVAYVLQRRAFGTLVGSFQTVQHAFADDVTALEGARLLAYEAAWSLEALPADARRPLILGASALLFAAETAFATAADALHFHGGYGYTVEYDIQLYYRRAKAWPLVAGDPRHERVALAHLLYEE
jgi:alkylation response protein AidB-like acyl-CoA dehydrogenase